MVLNPPRLIKLFLFNITSHSNLKNISRNNIYLYKTVGEGFKIYTVNNLVFI